MKILKQEKTGSRVKLEIEIDADEYSAAVDKVLKEAANSVKIPGFRQGKAPRSVVEKNVNPEYASQKALDLVVENNYPQIIKESGIHPVDYPFWKAVSAEEGNPCVFSIEVDVMPEIKLGNYKGLKGERKLSAITEKEVDEYVNAVREEAAQMQEIFDRPVKAGDIAELDVEGMVDGKVQDAISQRKLPILVGDQKIAPGFDENIVGMMINSSKEFGLSLPEDYFIKQFSGQEATFKVSVSKIVERNVPEFTDEFVKRISSFETAQAYWDDVKARMEAAAKERSDAELKDSLLEQVAKSSSVELPPSIVRRETESMMSELSGTLSRQGLTLENYVKSRRITVEKLAEELSPRAADRAKAKLVLAEIAKTESLAAADEEMKKEMEAVAAETRTPVDELMKNEAFKEHVREYLLRRKALDLVLENAKIK